MISPSRTPLPPGRPVLTSSAPTESFRKPPSRNRQRKIQTGPELRRIPEAESREGVSEDSEDIPEDSENVQELQDKTIPRSSSSSKSTNSPEIQKGYTDRFGNHYSQYSYLKTPQRNHQKESTQQAPTTMASSTTPPSTTAKPPALVEALLAFARANHGAVVDKPGLKVLREMTQPERLAPLSGGERPRTPNGWEVISAVVDSGATITALHPEDARDYKVEESEASRRGVTYGTAGKEDIANL